MKRFLSASPLMQQEGLALIRLIVGFFLIYHGWEVFSSAKINEYLQWDMFKKPNGKMLVYLGKGSELVGGILLFLGLFTRLGCLIIMGSLGYIAFVVGHGKVWWDDQYPFLFVLLALVFFFTGPGALSLDRLIFNRNKS